MHRYFNAASWQEIEECDDGLQLSGANCKFYCGSDSPCEWTATGGTTVLHPSETPLRELIVDFYEQKLKNFHISTAGCRGYGVAETSKVFGKLVNDLSRL